MLGQGNLNKVTWSPDQIRFYLLGYYGVYLYSSETWELLLHVPSAYGFDSFSQNPSPVADFSADGRYFGVAGSNGLLVYDVTTLEQVFMLPAEEQYRDITFFHSAERFASCTLDGKVEVFDLKSEQLLAEYQVEAETPPDCQKLAISTNDSRLVWVSGGKIYNWNFITGEVGKNPEFGNIAELVISADGTKIVASYSGSSSVMTTIWDSTIGIPTTTMWGQVISDYSPVTDQLAIIKYTPVIGAGMCLGPVSIWNFSNFKLVREITGSMGYSSVIFGPKGDTVTATADTGCAGIKEYSKTRYIRSWDLSTGKIIAQYPGKFSAKKYIAYGIGDLDYLEHFDVNGNSQILGLYGYDWTELTLWDHPETDPIMPLEMADSLLLVPPAREFIVSDFSFDWQGPVDVTSPDGKFRAIFNDKFPPKLQLIQIEGNQLIAEIKWASAATFTPDSNLLIVFGAWGLTLGWAEFWDLQILERVRFFHLWIGSAEDVDIISDGRLMRTKSSDQTVRWWAVLPGE